MTRSIDIALRIATGWSFAFPILPSQQARLERDMEREDETRSRSSTRSRRVRPGELPRPAQRGRGLGKVPEFKTGCGLLRDPAKHVRILIEKIGEKVDPCKVYPLAGPCQLVHCHYKCSVYFDELYWSDYPIPFNHRKARVEVVFIDKDHLRGAAARPRRSRNPDRPHAGQPRPGPRRRGPGRFISNVTSPATITHDLPGASLSDHVPRISSRERPGPP